ncbi:MAG: DUF423 domain-containing protein [Bacillota bacterium]
MFPKYFALGAINAALAIALGAFGAHGLENSISEHYLEVFETGVRYHMYSALGLMLISLFAKHTNVTKLVRNGGRLILAGTVLFSGSLYAIALSSVSELGIITPFGGVAILAGWTCVIVAALKKSSN